MAVFISATTDSFGEISRARPDASLVRRPLRGITIKDDTYAILRVLRANGEELRVFDSSSDEYDENGIGRSSRYSNFLIQSYQDQRVEKQQIVQTFGEDYIFFFGEQPRFINVSGILLNSKDFNWKNEFLENYERYLRGTRLVENNARLYLYVDDVVIEGALVNSSITQTADSPWMVQFQFQMFVCQYATLSNVGSVYLPSSLVSGASGTSSVSKGGLPPEGAAAPTGSTADTNRDMTPERLPFSSNKDEYPVGGGGNNRWAGTATDGARTRDEAVAEREDSQSTLGAPEDVEKKARIDLGKLGIDTTRRETTYLLLGRGAFAQTPSMGTFGVRQAEGTLDLSGLPDAVLNNF